MLFSLCNLYHLLTRASMQPQPSTSESPKRSQNIRRKQQQKKG